MRRDYRSEPERTSGVGAGLRTAPARYVRAPRRFSTDPALSSLAAETSMIYSRPDMLNLPEALLPHHRPLRTAVARAAASAKAAG